jgi:dCTP deaminase
MNGIAAGILADKQIEKALNQKTIDCPPVDTDQIQPASIDLRLGDMAIEMAAGILPGRHQTVREKLMQLLDENESDKTRNRLVIDIHNIKEPTVLKRGRIYIIPLQERLNLPDYIAGRANPKSTTGRLDVFTRTVTDYGTSFETIPPGYKGQLYIEVVPQTFDIVVQTGTRLNQLRLRDTRERPTNRTHEEIHRRTPIAFSNQEILIDNNGLWFTVNLKSSNGSPVGYRAIPGGCIDLAKINHYNIEDHWTPIYQEDQMILQPNEFYILASKERIRIPEEFSAEMIPFDSAVGEHRVHYAGFFDPGFGVTRTTQGCPGVLEVRCREAPFLLEDGQLVGRLVFEQMITKPENAYGQNIGSNYQGQSLKLSKHFKSNQ